MPWPRTNASSNRRPSRASSPSGPRPWTRPRLQWPSAPSTSWVSAADLPVEKSQGPRPPGLWTLSITPSVSSTPPWPFVATAHRTRVSSRSCRISSSPSHSPCKSTRKLLKRVPCTRRAQSTSARRSRGGSSPMATSWRIPLVGTAAARQTRSARSRTTSTFSSSRPLALRPRCWRPWAPGSPMLTQPRSASAGLRELNGTTPLQPRSASSQSIQA
mmetsp:Transcript_45396/g.97319  ORF Transcript_45396/g.97319 Transcript_45396/m.97319 type:complete len:216 (+) Transcript_45396:1934-2581(+)